MLRVDDEADTAAEPGLDHTFQPGTIDVSAGFAFSGFTNAPRSLVTSIFSWGSLHVEADVGLFQLGKATIGVGAEGFYGTPWAARSILGPFLAVAGVDLQAHDRGLALRATAHATGLSTFDPYAVGLVGISDWRVGGSFESPSTGDRIEAELTSAGARIGAGAGFNRTTKGGMVYGAELRYLVGTRFRRSQEVVWVKPDGTEEVLYEISGVARPPRGFSWTVTAGKRF